MMQGIDGSTSFTIGIDLGDRWSRWCRLDAMAQVVDQGRIATTEAGMRRALKAWPRSRIVIEAGTHSPWVSRLLQALGHEVLVANPRELPSLTRSDRKSDAVDAEQLARLGRADPKLLRPLRHRGEAAQRDRALLLVRDALVRNRAELVVRARALAKSLGLRLAGRTTKGFAGQVSRHQQREAFPGLGALLEIVEALGRQIRVLEREIEGRCQRSSPQTRLLRQVPGVGPITALAFVATIEDPQRFSKSRKVGAYLGLRPKRRQSGDSDPQLRISKSGDALLRRLLVQSAHYLLGVFGPDTELRRFGLRLAGRGGRAAKKKAIVAVARKLAVLLHRLWVTGEVYAPLHGTTAACAA